MLLKEKVGKVAKVVRSDLRVCDAARGRLRARSILSECFHLNHAKQDSLFRNACRERCATIKPASDCDFDATFLEKQSDCSGRSYIRRPPRFALFLSR